MPTDERERLLDLAGRLRERTQAGDLASLAALDRELGALLRGLAAARAPSAQERAALALLRQAHQRALAWVQREHDTVQAQLSDLCTHRDGRDAYAVAAE